MSSRQRIEERLRFLRKEFELLEQNERVFEEKLRSKSKDSRQRLESIKEYESASREYDMLLTEIEHKAVILREKLGEVRKIADEFYQSNY